MNIVQIQNRVQELPNTPQTMQYLNAAMNGQVPTVPPYVAAAELKRRETEGMMDQLAKGAAKGPQPTVKDQLEEKMGIMALMGQAQPPQRPQIPQPAGAEPQPQAEGGIDNLPVKEDMFGMAGGGIVAFNGETGSYATRTDVPLFNWLRSLVEDIENAPSRGKGTPQDVKDRRAAAVMQAAQAANTGGSSTAEQDAINAALKAAGASTSKLPAMTPPAKPPGARPPTAAKPSTTSAAPTAPGINLADQAPGMNLADALEASPEFQKLRTMANAANPYGGPQESQEDYIRRRREGILSQTGGKMPWETSEARLKEIEDRRRKEDADYEAMTKGEGRRLDNLVTLISNMGAGSFGQAGSRGVRALQQVEREQAAESQKRKDLRDQQSMKLMEIRALNDQAQFAEATGNLKEYERIQQEIKKLKSEYDLKQADIAKGVMEAGAGARTKDVEDKRAREKTIEESRQKGLDRESSERIARIQAAARNAGRGELTPAQAARIMSQAEQNIANQEKNNFRLKTQYQQNPAARAAAVEQEANRLLGGYTSGSPSPGTPAGGAPEGWGKSTVVKP